MKKITILLTVLICSMPAVSAEFLVKYRSSFIMQELGRSAHLRIMDVHQAGNLLKVDISENNKIPAMVQLLTNPSVEYVVPNARLHTFSAPLDPKALKKQWALQKVQAEAAWEKAGHKGSHKVVVAVIDTGVDSKHQALSPNMKAGFDFADNDSDPMDVLGQNPGHGTHCAGVIGATGLIEGGTMGISPDVSIMPIRFLDKNGGGDLNNGVKSIDYAIEKGVDIISASWGAAISKDQARPIIEAVERAEKAGIVFVVAAANDGKNNDNYEVYPANAKLTNTISVAASDANDKKPSWSNYGKAKVDLAAPGNEIVSTLPSNKYGNLSGTSMATPLVAGLVALIKAEDPSLTPTEIKSLLQSSGKKVEISTACDCRVDALDAVTVVKDEKMFVSPYGATLSPGETLKFDGVFGQAPFEFSSSNSSVATISDSGVLTAVADGETQVTVKDSKGVVATSHKIYVGKAQDPGNGGGGGGECPLGDPALCESLCTIMPDMPWCR